MRLRRRFKGFTHYLLRVAAAMLAAVAVDLILLQFLDQEFVFTIAPTIGAVFAVAAIMK